MKCKSTGGDVKPNNLPAHMRNRHKKGGMIDAKKDEKMPMPETKKDKKHSSKGCY